MLYAQVLIKTWRFMCIKWQICIEIFFTSVNYRYINVMQLYTSNLKFDTTQSIIRILRIRIELCLLWLLSFKKLRRFKTVILLIHWTAWRTYYVTNFCLKNIVARRQRWWNVVCVDVPVNHTQLILDPTIP